MKTYKTSNIKNVVLLGHPGSGKTTLAECMAFESGKINRIGSVEDKNTLSDYNALEHERGNSLFSSTLAIEWRDNKINLIDTPGFDDFVGEVTSSLKVCDTAVVVVNAGNGVEVGTDLNWNYAKDNSIPAIVAVNHIDHDNADFETTVAQLKDRFGGNITVVQYPLNAGPNFDSIVDVLKMVMYKFPADGGKPEKHPIPDDQVDKANALHNELVESVAENDETLMEIYFEKGSLDEEEMAKGLHLSLLNRDIHPVFVMSAKKNMGTGRMMGFINDNAPNALDRPMSLKDSEENIPANASDEPVLMVYKTASEQNLGNLSYFKVVSGTVSSGLDFVNDITNSTERINQIYVMDGKNRGQVTEMHAGDLGATVKLKNTPSNSTLSLKGKNISVDPITFPTPRIRTAVQSVNSGEEEKLAMALNQIKREDPSVNVEQSQELKQTIVSGQGELHLNMVKWKVENIFGTNIEFAAPKIPYRETINRGVRKDYRHKKQSGGSGQFGEVHMLVEPFTEGMGPPADLNVRNTEEFPLDWGGKLVFNNCIVGGAIDAKYMNAISKGIMEVMENGPLTGSYIRDVRVSVYDGKMHPVDSNDMAFKIAGRSAFKSAFVEAAPALLEPIYEVEVYSPEDIMGDIMSDLQTRRAVIMGMEATGHYQKITAKVPLAELYKYSSTLRSISQGRAKHFRKFDVYSEVPNEVQRSLVTQHQAAEVEA